MTRRHVKTMALLSFIAALGLIVFAGCGQKQEEPAQTMQTAPADTVAAKPEVTPTPQPVEPKPVEKKTEPVTPPAPKFTKITIPDSTVLEVTLTDTVQTNVNQVGDVFGGVLAKPVVVGDRVAFAEGTQVKCQITNLVKGGTLKTKPEIAFVITNIITAEGQDYGVVVSTVADTGRSHTTREAAMIGGGAAAGAAVGAILGKKKGAIIGAIAGAAAGTGAAAATGRENLVYPAGQTVSFVLQESLTVTLPTKK